MREPETPSENPHLKKVGNKHDLRIINNISIKVNKFH